MPFSLEHNFKYHAPTPDNKLTHEVVRRVCLDAAKAIEEVVPEGRERSLAITKIEEAMMWACAGIVRNS